jgi:hypothetical protein
VTESDAIRFAAMLAAIGHGWTDLHIDFYASEFRQWDDVEAAEVVVRRAMRTWTKPIRVPFGELHQDYLREVARRSEPAPTLPSGSAMRVRDGMLIAWVAYQLEARRDGRTPNRALFEKYLSNP